jgi:aryl-alcohol dehydrogenase-like predicted oxidoreductase
MEYVRFGRSGLKVSRLAYGLGLRKQGDADAAERVVEAAIDHGINLIDCANVYGFHDDGTQRGTGEQVLSRVLARHRDDLVITSKVVSPVGQGPNDRGASRFHILREIDRTLTRLGTDHVDIYLLHTWDTETPLEETARALEDVVRPGKARHVGVSNYQAWQVLKMLWTQDRLGCDPLLCIQNPYSLLDRGLEREMFPAQRTEGFGVMTYSPLAMGLLSGMYRPDAPPPEGSLFAEPRYAGRFEQLMDERARTVLGLLGQIAAERERTVAQVAINWILSHPEVTVAITGGDTLAQMEENAGAVGWSLSDDECARLDEASGPLRTAGATA